MVQGRRLGVRVGIATGPVVVGDIVGEELAREINVIGETPNVAARLLALAPVDGVVIAGGRYHASVSQGRWMPGMIASGQPGEMRLRRWAVPMGPEDLAYWPSTDRIWTVTEHPRRRWIASLDRAWLDR